MNISDPASPYEVGHYDTPGSAKGVAVVGCRAYVADYVNFGIYDISYFAPCPPPIAPDSLTILYVPDTQDFRLSWAPVLHDTAGSPVQVNHYVVFRGPTPDSVGDSIGAPTPPDTTVFIDTTAFSIGAKFFYQVKAVTE